jgi:hypothetical protein
LEKFFEMVWWWGWKKNHIKKNFEVEVFFSSQNIDYPFYVKRFLELSFFFSIFFLPLFLSLFLCSISWGLGGFDDFRGEKSPLQQLLFKWNGVDWLSVDIGGGRIFQNRVLHINMAKPWSWRWEVVDILAYFRVEVCTLIFLIHKLVSENLQNSNGHIP